MGPKAAVFCHNGLGDGIVSLILPNNLHLNGWSVDTYQNTLTGLQDWCPHLPILTHPGIDAIPRILSSYDWLFIFQNTASPFIQELIEEAKRVRPEQTKIFYIYPSRHIVNELYYEDTKINPSLPVAENLRLFCEKILHLPRSTRKNGLIPPPHLGYRKYGKRVAIHPLSSREGKNWPKEKYVKLALHLRSQGYDPVFLAGKDWKEEGFATHLFSSLNDLSSFLYESGYFIGNDSGPGHLASALDIPTLTLSRSKKLANLWAPSFSTSVAVTPSPWIPNIRGLRLRDRHWKRFISVGKVRHHFERLVKSL